MSVYHRLSKAEKEAEQRDRMREPAISCPHCEAKTTVDDLRAHIEERCPGRRPPHPRSRWISWGEAIELGVSRATLHRWVKAGLVTAEGEPGAQRYLLRDIVKMLSARRARGSKNETRNNRQSKRPGQAPPLPRRARRDRPLDNEARDRLSAFVRYIGGAEAASREMDIPARTLRAALAGRNVRRGTRALITLQLDRAEGLTNPPPGDPG